LSDVSIDLAASPAPMVSSAGAGDWFRLLKPRVMSLVIFTALVGMALAPGGIHPLIGFVALIAIAVGAGASGALNMWYDADIDRVMKRTAKRPIPSGAISAHDALQFGLVLSVLSVGVLGVTVNWLSAALLGFTIFFYVVVYTMWLKRWTPQNIVIGGAAGAFPPVIGWAAATGTVSVEAVALFLIIFFWTPPHFWALALLTRDDYAKAGVPMMPVVAGDRSTRIQIVAYSALMLPVAALPWALGFASPVYLAASLAASGWLVWLSLGIVRATAPEQLRPAAVRLFVYSIFYLFGLYALLLVERIVSLALGTGA
jgi:protoheme IX farnesyltransferase